MDELTKSCERCGVSIAKPRKYSARQWAELRFCSEPCRRPKAPACLIEACERPARGTHGYCGLHRQRVATHGDPMHRRWPSALARLLAKVRFGDCWEWTARRSPETGYGQAWANGTQRLAHRAVYELMVGPIPDGLQLDHLCRNRACVNPDHLEPVTSTESNRRMHAARRLRLAR